MIVVTSVSAENPVTPVLMMMDASFNFSITSSELCFHEVAIDAINTSNV